MDQVQPLISQVIDFLTELYDSGLGYSAINTARCALSQILIHKKGHCTVGAHPWVIKFMRGVYNLRPPTTKYTQTWSSVDLLLKQIRQMSPVKKLGLKALTFKTVALVAMVTAARAQTLAALSLSKMTEHKGKFCFVLSNSSLKQSRPGYKVPLIELKAYPVDRGVCVYVALREYLARTQALRNGEDQLFISYVKPHNKVSTSTLARWIKTLMCMAGIDISIYKAHSVRSATTSKAEAAGVPLEEILRTAGWSNAKTFAKYYNKPVAKKSEFANKILAKPMGVKAKY